MSELDPPFEPIIGGHYRASGRKYRVGDVQVIQVSVNTVLYQPVGHTDRRELMHHKATRAAFTSHFQPVGRTPRHPPLPIAARAHATAEATIYGGNDLIEGEHSEPKEPERRQESSMQALALEDAMAEPPSDRSDKSRRPLTADLAREIYLLACDVPVGATRWGHYGEVGRTYNVSDTLVAQIAKGDAWAAATLDLRQQRAADEAADAVRADLPCSALKVAPEPPPLPVLLAAAAPSPSEPPPTPAPTAGPAARISQEQPLNDLRVVSARAREALPADVTLADASQVLLDLSELTQTLMRCIERKRPLPSYVSPVTISQLTDQAETWADRLAEFA